MPVKLGDKTPFVLSQSKRRFAEFLDAVSIRIGSFLIPSPIFST